MPEWRPEDWINPLAPSEYATWCPEPPCDQCWTAFESGADAMLEALRKNGRKGNIPVFGGVLVFIPDSKEE